ncbi:DUF4870 domain-containing protein [Cellulomonas taurus]|uniref:DUF4870 domain-containing protein n=1 Tax=Cellulomonas taurus TaxID=2729175 RepID=UPI00145F560E|nr:DUF4870 domain-containing protein [Cellulomonas taurus]
MTHPPQPDQPWTGSGDPQHGAPGQPGQPSGAPGQPYGAPGQPYGAPGQQYGAPGQQYGAPQGAPLSPQDEKTWAILSHIGAILFSFVVPLIVWLVYRGRGPYLEDQAKEALNFSLTVLIGYVGTSILAAVTLGLLSPLVPLVSVAALIFGIIAAVAANKFTWYRYPVCIRFIK